MRRLCNHPGCKQAAIERRHYCSKHARTMDKIKWLTQDLQRPSPKDRGYNEVYRAKRAKIMGDGTNCQDCGAPADILHHTTVIRQADGSYIPNTDDLVPLCNSCHQLRHKRGTP